MENGAKGKKTDSDLDLFNNSMPVISVMSSSDAKSLAGIIREAEQDSRELANVFLSQSLHKHDPTSISNQIFDMINFVKKVPRC